MSNRTPYVSPTLGAAAFNCPYCHAYAQQRWSTSFTGLSDGYGGSINSPMTVTISMCSYCGQSCLWLNDELKIPNYRGMPPNDDLSDDIKKIYGEAGDISQKSPRAAAALLRLALEMLCIDLEGKGDSLEKKVKSLVEEKKVPAEVKQYMTAVRLTGNDAVHPGMIDFDESPQIVNALFRLINFIAEQALTKPREIAEDLVQIDNVLDGKITKQED